MQQHFLFVTVNSVQIHFIYKPPAKTDKKKWVTGPEIFWKIDIFSWVVNFFSKKIYQEFLYFLIREKVLWIYH